MPCGSPSRSEPSRHRIAAGSLVLAGLFLAGLFLAGLLACARPTPGPPARPLEPGGLPPQAFGSGETHAYAFELADGELAHLILEQQGIDLQLTVGDRRGRELAYLDSPNGGWGSEELWLAASSGPHRLEITAGPFAGRFGTGRYQLRFERRAATGADRQLVEAFGVHQQADRRRSDGAQGRDEARALFRRSRRLWRQLEAAPQEAMALYALMFLAETPEAAVAAGEEALALARAHRRRALEVQVLNGLGDVFRRQGDLSQAESLLRESAELAHQLGESFGEATALNNLAIVMRRQGRTQPAVELYQRALGLNRQLGIDHEVAITLRNIGFLFTHVSRFDAARGPLEEALAIARELGHRRLEVDVLLGLGWWHDRQGNAARALELYDQAGDVLAELRPERRRRATLLDRRGTALMKLGRYDEAAAVYEEALGQVALAPDEANTRANLSEVERRRGDRRSAAAHLERALELFRRGDDRSGELGALLQQARLLRDEGELVRAARRLETALDLVEQLRASSSDRATRLAFVDSRYDYYELYVDLLMKLFERDGDEIWARRALIGVERGRAQLLRDLLNEAGADLPSRSGERGVIGDMPAIQRDLLDDESLLLIYALGEERSFVFLVDQEGLTVRTLPAKGRIEDRAERLHELLSTSRGSTAREQARLQAAALSAEILGPVADELDRRRLVIVPDGALHAVPFAVLPFPGDDPALAEPLVVRHELVHLPSVSVLAALRRAPRRAGSGGLAVVADPVFHGDDSRLGSGSAAPAPHLDGLEPLPWSRREAEALLALAPSGEGYLGFAASRRTVLSGGLRDRAYLHFAAHGLLNAELSGLLLSRFEPSGEEVDGLLSLADVASLELSAELVVLSACRTALGQRRRGEGIVGLSHSFLQAGARGTMVSLWDVDDQATAVLMEDFYRRLLAGGAPPAAALAAAQRAMRSSGPFTAPYFWSAFVLQGEGR